MPAKKKKSAKKARATIVNLPKSVNLTFAVDTEMRDRVHALAQESDRTVSNMVYILVKKALK